MDALISIPSKMLALVMVAAFGSSPGLLILTAALSYTPGAFRIARSLAVNVNSLDFVQAATAFGVSPLRIMGRHILPNVMHIVLISLVMDFSALVLAEAVLSYVGVGVDPSMISFGTMINAARLEK